MQSEQKVMSQNARKSDEIISQKKYNNNKNYVSTLLMDFNEYEQSLIKCQYMLTVCDELINSLESKVLSKILQRTKLSAEQPQKELQKYDRIQAEFLQLQAKMNRDYQKKLKHLDASIKEQNQLIKKLKVQISLIKESRFQGERNTRLNIKKIKQTSDLEQQSIQLRKLLNIELQNLNSLQSSSIELNETIEKYEKKEIELKNKIKKAMEKENQYFRCKDMEEKYEALFLAKRKLVEQNSNFDSQKHVQFLNKITAIAQANENLAEMNRYENELGLMIKEKKFIIEEIQKREELHKVNAKKQLDEDDSQIFQEEINNLRKTIANRKFQQRAKSIHTSNKLEAFLNNSTPKNSIYYGKPEEQIQKKKSQHESIFKIQIEPISHLKQSSQIQHEDDKNYQRNQRKSMPTQISKKPANQSPKKPPHFLKDYQSQNKMPDFDTIEIETLQRIIKNKESRMKQALERTPIPSEFNASPINQFKSSQFNVIPRSNDQNKKILITEPIEPKYKSSESTIMKKQIGNSSAAPNIRFIEQIIESKNGENLDRLKNNVRIRTKKSQSEKYRYLEEIQLRKKMQQQRIRNSESRDSKITSSKTVQPSIEHQENFVTTNNSPAVKNQYKKRDLSFTSELENNEFMELDKRENQSEQKQHKIKYKDRIHSFSNEKPNLDNVLEKIDLLKKVKLENSQTKKEKEENEAELPGQKKEVKDKVKIFKLSASKRKYGNGSLYSRKGRAEGMQIFDSDEEEAILPKIQEEEESIRNTLQSIPHVE